MAEPTRKIHILAIDDDGVDLHLLKRACDDVVDWEVQFTGYSNPDEALQTLERTRVDVIFVNFRVGVTNGLEIVRRLRGLDEIRPIIFLTAAGGLVAKESIRIGADDYLSKDNLTPGIIRRAVEAAIHQYHYRRERALLERELREAQKMEAIGTLTAGLAHDFNNMLAGMLGDTELAIRKNNDQGVEPHLTNVQHACHRMAELIHRLLTFKQSNSNELSVVSLRLVIEHTLALLVHTLPDNVRLDTELPDDPLWTKAKPAGLQQVIMNLCVNAAEAMKEGGCVTLRVNKNFADDALIRAFPQAEGKPWLRLEVEDRGAGIDPAYRDRIFDPFFTTKALGARKGTGLGLAIVWQLVRDFGGWIQVDSELRRGSRFSIYLPYAEQSVAAPRHHKEGLPRGSETILVVDDEASVLEATARMLEHLGYTVLTATDGALAVTRFQQDPEKIACVLLDLSMPNVNGMECSRHLQALAPGLPIIFTSGHDLEPHLATLAEVGAKASLQKPYELADLAYCLRAALDNTGGQEQQLGQ